MGGGRSVPSCNRIDYANKFKSMCYEKNKILVAADFPAILFVIKYIPEGSLFYQSKEQENEPAVAAKKIWCCCQIDYQY